MTTREELTRRMSDLRAETLRLFSLVEREADLHESPGGGFRPIIWHLAHIGVFEGYWLLQKLRDESPTDARYESIFDPIQTPREESKNLPSRGEMEAYLARVREAVQERSFTHLREDDPDPLLRDAYIFQLVLEHERQHQETLLYLLQMLEPSKKRRPPEVHDDGDTYGANDGDNGNQLEVEAAATPLSASAASVTPVSATAESATAPSALASSTQAGGMVTVAAGECVVGAGVHGFAYDNERPSQTVFVPAFQLDRLPVTNAEYARFIEAGGYRRRECWSAEGWEWREREGWTQPLYWRRAPEDDGGGWLLRRMFDEVALPPAHPVTGVSWFEAEAYARFAGKRLPTEFEWEKAASWDEERRHKRRFAWGDAEPSVDVCNFGNRFWGTTPVGSFPAGASFYGCLDMTGNVWEWTGDAFAGFPGFEAFPYPEYSETWFDGDHRVLKGGSWATSASVLRTSFRNFFRRPFRIGFAGFRCAADV